MTEILLAIQMGQTNHGHCEILKLFLPTEKKNPPQNLSFKMDETIWKILNMRCKGITLVLSEKLSPVSE